jgi:hypothetical protein
MRANLKLVLYKRKEALLDKKKRLLFMRANPKVALFKRKAAFYRIRGRGCCKSQSKAGSFQNEGPFNKIRGRESNTKLALFKRKAAFNWIRGRGFFL